MQRCILDFHSDPRSLSDSIWKAQNNVFDCVIFHLDMDGFFRPYVKQVIYRFPDCGILHNGFACVKCQDCNYQFLLTLGYCIDDCFLPGEGGIFKTLFKE